MYAERVQVILPRHKLPLKRLKSILQTFKDGLRAGFTTSRILRIVCIKSCSCQRFRSIDGYPRPVCTRLMPDLTRMTSICMNPSNKLLRTDRKMIRGYEARSGLGSFEAAKQFASPQESMQWPPERADEQLGS